MKQLGLPDFEKYLFCPKGDSLLLLRAALTPDPEQAQAAWREWRHRHTLQGCELKMHRLMPVLYRRFQDEGLDLADHRILRGVYRYSWTRNQMMLRKAQHVTACLSRLQIPVLLIKGLPLSLMTYRDIGARPMWDFDIVVPPECRQEAADALAALGWTNSQVCMPGLAARHSHDLYDGLGSSLDLHWFCLATSRWPGADDDFWSHSVPIAWDDKSGGSARPELVRTLRPEHHLVHVCLHGTRYSVEQDLGWVCDAVLILRNHHIDFALVLESARQHRAIYALRLMLSYLHQQLDVPLPEAFLQQLSREPIDWTDRFQFLRLQTGKEYPVWAPLVEYLRWNRRFRILEFLDFLRQRWRLRTIWQVPLDLGRRAFRKVLTFFFHSANI